jgi:hypothetical protein
LPTPEALLRLIEELPVSIRGLALDEAAALVKRAESYEQIRSLVQAALREKYEPKPKPADYYGGPWIRDFYADRAIFEWEGKTWQVEFTITKEGGTNVTLGEPVEVEIAYTPIGEAIEALAIESDFMPLVEAKGKVREVKLIAPGWGSSGYYSAAMLEADGPKVFRKGLKQFWNHPSKTEEADRPERDLRDLAAVLTEDAHYEKAHPKGPGLYAKTEIFDHYTEAVDQLAPHIGVSIRATGKGKQGEVEGRKGPIIESIVAAKSVDFVTQPGAGGQVLSLFEAARNAPVLEPQKEPDMSEAELKEAQDARAKAEADLAALKESNAKAELELSRLREAGMQNQARQLATDGLAKANLPEPTKARLVESLSKNPPTKDGAIDTEAFAKALLEAAREEAEYLAKITDSGAIRGMGTVTEASGKQQDTALDELGEALGLSESARKVFVAGRN